MTAPTNPFDASAQPMRGLSARAQAFLKPKPFAVYSKAKPAKQGAA